MIEARATTDSKAADPQVAEARRRARRTAWMVAGVALAIYAAFFVLGMTGHVR
ncbi:MAG: hypothetical protein JSR70_10510 [Proteobacteria bacterium]|nr:hypothetical protein [Pseudomonadota bacterium]